MKRLPFICLLVPMSYLLCAQKTISGRVVDSISGEAVAYASVGISDQHAGTISNETGYFNLIIADSLQSSLRISALGYESRLIHTAELKDQVLLPRLHTKEPVLVTTVAGRNSRMKGNRVRRDFLSTDIGGLSSEVAVRIRITEPTTELSSFFVRLAKGGSDSLPVFRINVYQPDLDGKPGPSLLRENIIVHSEIAHGLIEMDLRSYHILSDQDVYVSLEWLNNPGEKGYLLSSRLTGTETWIRTSQQRNWIKSNYLKPGISVRIMY